MTDDTLRIECAPMIDRICYTVTLPENAGRPDRIEAAVADMLLAFARAQQAKGLREAAAIAAASAILDKPASDEFESGYENGCVSVSLKLDAQATAREGKS